MTTRRDMFKVLAGGLIAAPAIVPIYNLMKLPPRRIIRVNVLWIDLLDLFGNVVVPNVPMRSQPDGTYIGETNYTTAPMSVAGFRIDSRYGLFVDRGVKCLGVGDTLRVMLRGT